MQLSKLVAIPKARPADPIWTSYVWDSHGDLIQRSDADLIRVTSSPSSPLSTEDVIAWYWREIGVRHVA